MRMSDCVVMDKKLIELKNLGHSSVNLLGTLGIQTQQDLHNAGSVNVYRQLRRNGAFVSVTLLFALEGALLDTPWQLLSPGLKAQLTEIAARIDQEESQHTAFQ